MRFSQKSLMRVTAFFLFSMSLLITPSLFSRLSSRAQTTPTSNPDPWTSSQTLQPADLARELADIKQVPPAILYVGVRALFNGGHIPGSTFHGTTSTEKGLAEMKTFVEPLPRSTNLVIYCGCCPFER